LQAMQLTNPMLIRYKDIADASTITAMQTLSKLFSLDGKVALITGGSRGIGKMIARGFLEAGCRKVYISGRNPVTCDATAEELGPRCVSVPQDISTVHGCSELLAKYLDHEDRLDILLNNAGLGWEEDFEHFSEKGWDEVMDVNLKSPFFLTQALFGILAAAAAHERPAKVINIASIDAVRLSPAEAYSYYASKSALIFLTRHMAARLIRHNIVVSGIAPGSFATDLNVRARDRGPEVAERNPSRRIGTDEDMQGAAIYLASRAGDWVVGDTLVVDGGLSLAACSP
jgi:NAD(P)-dependent dehydrogenase (short-subunit alcohol dehydrogenase family)